MARDVSTARGVKVKSEAPESVTAEKILFGRSYAVVIGVSHYADDRFEPLAGAARDARAVGEVLKQHGFQVKTFLDQAATRDALRTHLSKTLLELVQPRDRVVVFFAGHGDTLGEDRDAIGYILPYDTDFGMTAVGGISMTEIRQWFMLYKANQVMFAADSCYSGLTIPPWRAPPQKSNEEEPLGNPPQGASLRSPPTLDPETLEALIDKTSEKTLILMTAGKRGQKALEYERAGHGMFSYFFIEALKGAAVRPGKAYLTAKDIATRLDETVPVTAKREYGVSQDPQIGILGEGDFIFLVNTDQPLSLGFNPAGIGLRSASHRCGGPFNAFRANCPLSPQGKAGHGLFWSGLGLVVVGGGATGMVVYTGERIEDGDTSLKSDNYTWSVVSITGLSVGGVAMLAGLVLWAIDPGYTDSQAAHALGLGFSGREAQRSTSLTWTW